MALDATLSRWGIMTPRSRAPIPSAKDDESDRYIRGRCPAKKIIAADVARGSVNRFTKGSGSRY
jgi:hypothetical protein